MKSIEKEIIKNPIYSEMEDEELVDLAHCGDNEALDYLIQKYRNYVHAKSRSYFLIGADQEDVVQEGLIGLFKAIRDYKKEKLNNFKSFADLCITRQMITAIKTATRLKHSPLNSYVSLDKPIFDKSSDQTLVDILKCSRVSDPEELLINKEEIHYLEAKMSALLTDLEREVLYLYLDGVPYKEISGEFNRSVKAIDNALTRVKRKLEKYLDIENVTLL